MAERIKNRETTTKTKNVERMDKWILKSEH